MKSTTEVSTRSRTPKRAKMRINYRSVAGATYQLGKTYRVYDACRETGRVNLIHPHTLEIACFTAREVTAA